MKFPRNKKRCKKCKMIYWRKHRCRFDREQNRNKQEQYSEPIIESKYSLKTKMCKRCRKQYIVNSTTEQYHLDCKIVMQVAKW